MRERSIASEQIPTNTQYDAWHYIIIQMAKRSNCKREQKLLSSEDKSESEIFREGRWSESEKIKYMIFLQVHFKKFIHSSKRKWKIYKALSAYLETRSPEQCRSHHRKLLLRFETLQKIVDFGKNQCCYEEYSKEYDNYCKEGRQTASVERNYTKNSKVIEPAVETLVRQPPLQQQRPLESVNQRAKNQLEKNLQPAPTMWQQEIPVRWNFPLMDYYQNPFPMNFQMTAYPYWHF